jgi:hypothetical protein
VNHTLPLKERLFKIAQVWQTNPKERVAAKAVLNRPQPNENKKVTLFPVADVIISDILPYFTHFYL